MQIQQLQQLPLEQKIGQLFFIGLPGTTLDAEALSLLDEVRPGGVCLFSRNIRERAQTRELIDGICRHSAVIPFISLDQEGGLVDRLRRVLEPMPAPDRFRDPEDVRLMARLIAEAVRILGFNVDFAPVVDVIDDSRRGFTNGLHSRAYGNGVEDVVSLAGRFLAELDAGGCIGCLKHFPGLGAAEVDSHEELPVVNIGEEVFGSVDLAPYARLLPRPESRMVMVAHAAFPGLDLQEADQNGRLLPSSLSYSIVTQLLREKLGFNGVAVTDDMEMGAIVRNYGMAEACRMAVAAGEDMLAICAGPDAIREGYHAVLDAARSGQIAAERIDLSLERIQKLKQSLSPPLPFDEARLDAVSDEIRQLKNRLS